MPDLRYVYTRTHLAVRFANPYKRCNRCGDWITGYLVFGSILSPCGHDEGYTDVCPSWSPVDGCQCAPPDAGHGLVAAGRG